MSFSQNVKSELSHHYGAATHCNIAEIAAIINTCGTITQQNNQFSIKIQTENVLVARKYFTLVKKTFNIDNKMMVYKNNQLKKNRVYVLTIDNNDDSVVVLKSTGIMNYQNDKCVIENYIYPPTVSNQCCKRAYIRGAFIASGSVSDPEKNYHIEFVSSDQKYSQQLKDLINTFKLDAKIVERKEHYVVYLKEGEKIVDIFNIMGAHVALMELENVRILKNMRNNVNRIVNCETANLNKTISASVKQIDDINYIKNTVGFSHLPSNLKEIAQLRLEFPDASLKELGQMVSNPVGKSGVNHRLRKISEIAEALKKEKGED